MRKLLTTLALLAIVALPAGASQDQHLTYPLGTVLSGVALNGAAATRTFYIGPNARASDYTDSTDATSGPQLRGFSKLLLELKYTHNNNGAITTTCTGGGTRATATSTLTTCTVAAGTCTVNFGGVFVTSSLSADKDWTQVMGLNSEPAIKCVISHGGTPDADDTITVNAWLMAD